MQWATDQVSQTRDNYDTKRLNEEGYLPSPGKLYNISAITVKSVNGQGADHVTRWLMTDERLPKENLQWGTSCGKTLQRWPYETLQSHPQNLTYGLQDNTRVLDKVAHQRGKSRSLIRKGTDDYKAKQICIAKRKRNERMVRANISPSESVLLCLKKAIQSQDWSDQPSGNSQNLCERVHRVWLNGSFTFIATLNVSLH